MRTCFLFSLFCAVLVSPSFAQLGVVGDSVVVHGGEIKDKPSIFGDTKSELSRGDTVKVLRRRGEDYFEVAYGKVTGLLSERQVMTSEEEKEYEREIEAQRRSAKEMREYLRSLREKGYTIVLARQTFEKNSADGISVGLGLVNISENKTIKYLRITWKLFNSVGEPTVGQNSGRSTARTKLVGPLKPRETGYTEFENAWDSSVGTCAEIRGIVVEHIDGSSFTYINDLKDIAMEDSNVRLRGDCSYEAQQERKN
jgi:hypothetical protein